MAFLNEDLVEKAVQLCLPSIRDVCAQHTWGPKGVVIAVMGKGMVCPYVHVMKELGDKSDWKTRWGDDSDFEAIALSKVNQAWNNSMSNRTIVGDFPWLLENGDTLYTGSACESSGLAVAVSGSHEYVDEAVSWVVWNVIRMLCLAKVQGLKDQGSYLVL